MYYTHSYEEIKIMGEWLPATALFKRRGDRGIVPKTVKPHNKVISTNLFQKYSEALEVQSDLLCMKLGKDYFPTILLDFEPAGEWFCQLAYITNFPPKSYTFGRSDLYFYFSNPEDRTMFILAGVIGDTIVKKPTIAPIRKLLQLRP